MKMKEKPHIDYKTAQTLAVMHDFIMAAKYEREFLIEEIDKQINSLEIRKSQLKTVSNDPDNWIKAFDVYGFKDNIARLRERARESGLTHTLFEKLKDKDFRDRFTGWGRPPVQKNEIEDHYSNEEEA